MKPFRWNREKNEQLKVERAISFEEIVLSIESEGLLDILKHPDQEKHPNQLVFVVVVFGYVYLVPFVEEADYYFLKTIIPSRKAKKDYLRGRTNEKEI
ncbi:MAG: toxin [Deltaproteobacteria bacterium]|nr:toxin [Deltaproteobacteria bacterium]